MDNFDLRKYLAEGSKGKKYEKPIGHYSDFGAALEAIMKAQLNEKNGEYSSIQEYLNKWNKIKSNLNNIKEKIGI